MSNSNARELLLDIARELNRPPSTLETFIQKLEANWFDSYESMKNLSMETLDSLGFPKMLSNAVLARLSNIPVSNSKIIEETKTLEPIVETNPDYLLTQIVKSGKKEEILECLGIMIRLLRNILNEPRNMKFRSVKMTNPKIRSVLERKEVMKLFEYLNFRRNGEVVELGEYDYEESKMRNIVRAIDSRIEELNPPPSQPAPSNLPFNPFGESVISNGTPNIKDLAQKSGPMSSDYTKMLSDLKAKRLSLIQPVRDREVKFVQIVRRGSGVQVMHQEPEIREEEQLIKAEILKVMNSIGQSQNFSSARRKEFEALAKKPLFVKTLIRFRFPDDRVLQAVFSPLERMDSLYKVIEDVVSSDVSFYLYQSPPLQKLPKNMRETLDEMSLVPQANVFVSVNNYKAGQELFKKTLSLNTEQVEV